jgi:hypothetical protein
MSLCHFFVVQVALLLVAAFASASPAQQAFSAETLLARVARTSESEPDISLSSGICDRTGANYHTRFVDRSTNQTYFFSTTLCPPPSSDEDDSLTPATAASTECNPSGARFRIMRVNGIESKDRECGEEATSFYRGVVVLNKTMPEGAASSALPLGYLVGVYRNRTSRSDASAAELSSPQLLIRLECNASAGAFRVNGVTGYGGGATVVVDASADCEPTPPKSRVAFYVALVFVMFFIGSFGFVLWRAKLAGDRLRELKRRRGERVWLG